MAYGGGREMAYGGGRELAGQTSLELALKPLKLLLRVLLQLLHPLSLALLLLCARVRLLPHRLQVNLQGCTDNACEPSTCMRQHVCVNILIKA
eukprot:1627135-Rhodomonas_salina.2